MFKKTELNYPQSEFDLLFEYAKNLFNNNLAFAITSQIGQPFMALTMCYSKLIPLLSGEPHEKYELDSDRFNSLDSSNIHLTDNEKIVQELWLDLKVNVLQKAEPHNTSTLQALKHQFIKLADSFRSDLEKQLNRLLMKEHARFYKKDVFFGQTNIYSNEKTIHLITHAINDDCQTRQACINLGWMNKELKLTLAFQAIIKYTLLERDLLLNNENIFEPTPSPHVKNEPKSM